MTTPIPPDLRGLVREVPRWDYPAEGQHLGDGTVILGHLRAGACRLRVFADTQGWTVVVTELGLGVSVTNAAFAIYQIVAHLPGLVTFIEHYPADMSPVTGEHLTLFLRPDQREAGTTAWRHLWPASPVDQQHDELDAWMARNGAAILERPVPDPADHIRGIIASGGDPWPGETVRCGCAPDGTVVYRGAAREGYDEPDFRDLCQICGGTGELPVRMLDPYGNDEPDEDPADYELAGSASDDD